MSLYHYMPTEAFDHDEYEPVSGGNPTNESHRSGGSRLQSKLEEFTKEVR